MPTLRLDRTTREQTKKPIDFIKNLRHAHKNQSALSMIINPYTEETQQSESGSHTMFKSGLVPAKPKIIREPSDSGEGYGQSLFREQTVVGKAKNLALMEALRKKNLKEQYA